MKNESVQKRLLRASLISVGIYVACIFAPFTSGYAWFPIATLKCGHEPYITNDFAAAFSYSVPGDALYGGPDIFTYRNDFYCSETEAKMAGYSVYSWGEERCKSFDDQGVTHTHCADPKNIWLSTYVPAALLWASIMVHYSIRGKWREYAVKILKKIRHRK